MDKQEAEFSSSTMAAFAASIAAVVFCFSSSLFAYDGPIVDGHLHISYQSDPAFIRDKFKNLNVARAVIFPREFKAGDDVGITEEKAREFLDENPDLGYVLLGLQLDRLHKKKPVGYWRGPSSDWEQWLRYAETELRSGRRKGMGELIVRHYDYHGKGNGEVDFPIKSEVFKSLLNLSNMTRRPLVMHAEGEEHVVRDLLEVLPSYPDAKVVWAHACGRSDPSLVATWLSAHSNLYCDLGNMTDTGRYGSLWPRAGAWTFQFEVKGKIKPEWIRVLKKYPSRFYIGSDVNEVQGWNRAWETRMKRFRSLLDQLDADTAEWVAFRTAETLYGW